MSSRDLRDLNPGKWRDDVLILIIITVVAGVGALHGIIIIINNPIDVYIFTYMRLIHFIY